MKRTLIMALAGLFVLSSMTYAQNRPRRRMNALRQQLQVEAMTVELREDIQNLRQEWNKEKAVNDGELKAARIELQQLLQDESTTESNIKSQLDKIAALGVDIRMGGIMLNKAVKELMTPEQWQSYQLRNTRRGQFGRGSAGQLNPRFNRGQGNRGRFWRGGGNLQGRGFDQGFRRFDNSGIIRGMRGGGIQGNQGRPLEERGRPGLRPRIRRGGDDSDPSGING